MTRTLDLDVDTPEKVVTVLRNAVEAYRDSYAVLSASWQDTRAGRDWSMIAKVLENAADKIEKKVGKS